MGDWSDSGVMFALATLGAVALGAEVAKRTGVAGSRALTKAERDQLPSSDFVFPNRRAYPVPTLEYGRLALTMATWPNNLTDLPKVKKVVFARYPSLIDWWNQRPWVQDRPRQRVTRKRRAA